MADFELLEGDIQARQVHSGQISIDAFNQASQPTTDIQHGLTMIKLAQQNHVFVKTSLTG